MPVFTATYQELVSLIPMAALQFSLLYIVATAAIFIPISAQLNSTYYDKLCPKALPAIRNIVWQAIQKEPRMGASLLRLHFHDCFVNGCDASILLDDTRNFTGEKTALPNANSVRGFDVVDQIKTEVNRVCKRNIFSCADILAVAARDSVFLLGGPEYKVLLGRKDARTASRTAANNNLPPPFFNLSQLVSSFQSHGLTIKDLVALSGGHTLGISRCTNFRNRIYNDVNIDSAFAKLLQGKCPKTGGDNNTQQLDATTNKFDTQYFSALMVGKGKGVLHSDQELYKNDGSSTDQLVKMYAKSPSLFAADFSRSMIKMGNMKPSSTTPLEIRLKCRNVN